MHQVHLAKLRLAAIAADALGLTAAWVAVVAARATFHAWWPFDLVPGAELLAPVNAERALPLGILVVPAWLGALHVVGSWRGLRRKPWSRALTEVGSAGALSLLVVLSTLFLLRIEPASRTLLLGYTAVAGAVVVASRAAQAGALASLRRRAWDPHRVLLVGDAGPWLETVRRNATWGIDVEQVAPEALPEALHRGRVDEVYLAGTPDPAFLTQAAHLCDELGVPLSLDGNFLGLRTSRADLVDYDGWGVLTFSSTPRRPLELVVKRALDLFGAASLLAVTAPLLAGAALAIRLADGGPVLFVQERAGRFGRPFRMLKLRTMIPDAEDRRAALVSEADGPVFKLRDDPRVTAIGRWLRRWSIDELPQLVNVLQGEMSLVGPRPPLPAEVARYERWQLRRLSVTPGLTCTWQVSGRSDLPFEQWMALDLAYIDNWSLWLDLGLLARTVPAVLRGTGAR